MNEDDAFQAFSALKDKFGWSGTVFNQDDVRKYIADRREADNEEPYTDEQLDDAVATVMNSDSWNEWLEESMCEHGWDALGSIIFDEVEYPEEQSRT